MKRAPRALSAALLFLVAAGASAQGSTGFHWGILGGVTRHEGGGAEDAFGEDAFDTGWHGGGLLVFNIPVIPVGLRVDATYHKLDEPDSVVSSRDVEILAATANVTVGFRLLVLKPYVVGGVGYYRLDFSDESLPSAFSSRNNETGWNAGAGVSISLRKIDIFVEARYHSVSYSPAGENFKFVPVSVGLAF
jgi:opacity protein-like surface antigen